MLVLVRISIRICSFRFSNRSISAFASLFVTPILSDMTISFRRSLLHPILLFRTQRSEIEYKVDGQTSIHVLNGYHYGNASGSGRMDKPEYIETKNVRIKRCLACGIYCKICETKKTCCLLNQPSKKGEKNTHASLL